MTGCPFCEVDATKIFHGDHATVQCLWDGYPVSPGHALVITRRHVPSWFDATREEHLGLLDGIEIARQQILKAHSPMGFNIGVNVGATAGQTIPHLHVHVIPRYSGDVPDPRGGVRYVIPDAANYLDERVVASATEANQVRDGARVGSSLDAIALFGTDNNPLLPALIRDLEHATLFDLAVAFVLESGLLPLRPHLEDLIDRGGTLRVLTGDYLDATEPAALLQLLDLQQLAPDRMHLRVFETGQGISFHPKAYLISGERNGAIGYVGSSNISRTALVSSVEWNYRLSREREPIALRTLSREFTALFTHVRTTTLTTDWVARYTERRRHTTFHPEPTSIHPEDDAPPPSPKPHAVQVEALKALAETRRTGHRAGLVVLATGLGKTWLAAFDGVGFKRVLFVAHREEILRQALDTFRRIRPQANLGYFTGEQKDANADVLFASIMTLGQARHLHTFSADHFDYIVVDEFHHAAAATYRRLIDYFEPKFLLGLTATPDRTDGGDLLSLCAENLVYRCDLVRGVDEGLLAPFHYFGIPDLVDYSNIPWRGGRFDPNALDHAVATEARAANALEQWQKHKGTRTLAFCVSQRHANYMAQYFRDRSLRAVAVHAGADTAPRAKSLEDLEAGQLDVVFAVDMFNEGVDVPTIDTVLMLRPTESKILWLQQFGRGLRKASGKSHLTVVDYIGNHRCFLQAAMVLLPGAGESRGELSLALERVANDTLELPLGCSVQYELEALNILRALAAPPRSAAALSTWYRAFAEEYGTRPTASEAWHAGFDPRSVRREFGSWFGFVAAQASLAPAEARGFEANRGFFAALEKTPMTKSYKMLVVLAMIGAGRFPGDIRIDDLATQFRHQARRSLYLERDVGEPLNDDAALRRLIEQNPIDAWIEGKGTDGVRYFEYTEDTFRTRLDTPVGDDSALANLAREICDWRLAEYVTRANEGHLFAPAIRCRVSHSGNQPILFLPDRGTHPGIPDGWVDITVDDSPYRAKFAKIAVNVVEPQDGDGNRLPEILRAWFGPSAGEPGSADYVVFRRQDNGYAAEPEREGANGPLLWREYQRAEIPPLFGLEFGQSRWNQGFVFIGRQMFLLVSLEKGDLAGEHQYADRFISSSQLTWQSQNRHSRESKVGQQIKQHHTAGIAVHLFVRLSRKTPNGKAAPFTYCGEVDFRDWSGDKPITIEWELRSPLPAHVAMRLAVMTAEGKDVEAS